MERKKHVKGKKRYLKGDLNLNIDHKKSIFRKYIILIFKIKIVNFIETVNYNKLKSQNLSR